ncbi:zinc finger protein 595-like [Toxorhynchites rutilus septentrionalis]|uniref:zinc finger protein 595-like n=1 Tax=Toxorhynchites rutilus septentrionalis TaxID=329112 RepID=UPI0024788B5B|nr:zinc finger protein 595-like [Toxorhynchites rutilus septentrionalis]
MSEKVVGAMENAVETAGTHYRNPGLKLEPIKTDESDSGNNLHDRERAEFVQEQIKLEPIDIKNEPSEIEFVQQLKQESIDVKNELFEHDDETICNNNKNKKSSPSSGKSRCRKERKTIPNKCYICDTMLESQSVLNDHLESHKDMIPYNCSQCSTEANPIEASNVTTLNKHFETHGFKYICLHCPLRYRTGSSLTYHVQKFHERKFNFNCEFCGRAFNNYQDHRAHVNIHKNLMMERFKCEPCQKLFQSKRLLLLHQKTLAHIGLVREKQNKTQSDVTNSEKVKSLQFIRRSRPGTLERKLLINVNGYDHNISEHMDNDKDSNPIVKKETIAIDGSRITINHDGELTVVNPEEPPQEVKIIPNKCFVCDTVFESASGFKGHLTRHRYMLPYKCAQCSTATNPIIFTTMILLNRHLESHSFNFICPHCPSRYRRKNSLIHHVKSIHINLKAGHSCETRRKALIDPGVDYQTQQHKWKFCQKYYTARSSLKRHQVMHVGQQLAPVYKEEEESQPEMTTVEMNNAVSGTAPQRSTMDPIEESHHILIQTENDKIVVMDPNDIEKTANCDKTTDQSNNGESFSNKKNESSHPDEPVEANRDARVGKTIPNKCYICGPVHENEDEFTEHLESHKSMLPYKCLQCSIEARTLLALNRHFQRHEFKYVCPHCPLRYRTDIWLTFHIQSIHGDQKVEYYCKTCGKGFNKNKYHLYRKHVNAHNDLALQRHKCEPCQKVFSLSSSLINHQASYSCKRNTKRKSQKSKSAQVMSKMFIEEKNNAGEVEAVEQIITTSSQVTNHNTVEQDASNSESSPMESNPSEFDGRMAAIFIQEQINLEPIDIKNEPPESDDEVMNDDEPTHSHNNENGNSSHFQGKPPCQERRKKTF